ncbi:hypothetical protein LTR56_027092 [Elasticomyces elasticus]|nr:hypothetical protein LTR56_027092 [Elasticomyces elasticus]KAK3616392.1 hypothetical protein LTR22_027090 [Elasticomyces elasticus]
MATGTHTIKSIFENIYPIRSELTEMLTATDLSTFCYAFDIKLTDTEKDHYLKPIRDLVDQEEWIRNEVAKGTKISIVGTSLPLWIMRIREPTKYWGMFKEHMTIRVWILAKVGNEELETIVSEMKIIEEEMSQIREEVNLDEDDWDEDGDPRASLGPEMERYILLENELNKCAHRSSHTLTPPGKSVNMRHHTYFRGREPFFSSNRTGYYTGNWYFCRTSTPSSVEVVYRDVILMHNGSLFMPPQQLGGTKSSILHWLPHSIIDVDEDKIGTWVISLSKNLSTIDYIDGTEDTKSHRFMNESDIIISATFTDTVGNSWNNALSIRIGHA